MIVAGTGHRPKYLPCKYDENHKWLRGLKTNLEFWLEFNRPELVISGGAIGWDMWLAETAIAKGIDVELYLPFKGTGSTWPKSSKRRLERILDTSKATYYSESYHDDCFKLRDVAMVDNCDILLACWSGVKYGGTYQTIKYAEKVNREIINFFTKG